MLNPACPTNNSIFLEYIIDNYLYCTKCSLPKYMSGCQYCVYPSREFSREFVVVCFRFKNPPCLQTNVIILIKSWHMADVFICHLLCHGYVLCWHYVALCSSVVFVLQKESQLSHLFVIIVNRNLRCTFTASLSTYQHDQHCLSKGNQEQH